MHLELVKIKNFRNLGCVEIPLRPGTVIVGENRSGKSNLVHALRLVLDPTLGYPDRQLRREDSWEGLSDGSEDWDPFESRHEIRIEVAFGGIDDAEGMAALGQALIEGDPMRARMVYRFAPRETEVPEGEVPPYDWSIRGGVTDQEIWGDLRRHLRLQYLSALRDVETDIAYWRRSPLRPLLEAAAARLDRQDLVDVAAAVEDANKRVLELEPVAELSADITSRTTSLVGDENSTETQLGVASSDPQRILRNLRLFVDAAARPLASASLGSLNVLYFALLQLSLEREVAAHDIAHVVLAIEEPEAHLHPHVQRLIFRDALRSPSATERTVVVTTHSPHIVSVTPPQALVVLRGGEQGATVGVAGEAELEPAEWADVERYLDATRGEFVFARRVLLVEGFAEAVLLPKLAADAGVDLDKAGISVCAIHGTHFSTYARYLTAIGTPWAIATDGDPKSAEPDEETEGEGDETEGAESELSAGSARAQRLLELLELEGSPEDHGVFVGEVTLELDLLAASARNRTACLRVLAEHDWAKPTATKLEAWLENPDDIDAAAYMRIVRRFGKGRFAQRLAAQQAELDAPAHIARAVARLAP